MLDTLTPAYCTYRLLQVNIAALIVAFLNKNLLSFIIKHKQRAQVVFAISALLLAWFTQSSISDYKDRGEAPTDEVALLEWKSTSHKIERDIYLGLATLISSCFLYSVAY